MLGFEGNIDVGQETNRTPGIRFALGRQELRKESQPPLSQQVLLIGTPVPRSPGDLSAVARRAPVAVADVLTASGLEVIATPPGHADHERRGSITIDALRRFESGARDRAVWQRFGLVEGEYALVILRRPVGDDDARQLERLTRALAELAPVLPVVFLAHEGTRARLAASGGLERLVAAGVHCVDPLRYLDLLSLKTGAGAVLTDSGRVAEEAAMLDVPCFRLEVAETAPASAGDIEALLTRPEPAAAPQPVPADTRETVLGVSVDALDMEQTLAACERIIEAGSYSQHVCVNVAKLMAARRDPDLRKIIERCAIISADGQPIVWASRLLGRPVPARVAGIDLMHELIALAARKGLRPYIVGARSEILDDAVARMREQHPDLELAGWHHGYFSDEEAPEVCREIRESNADMLFVAMGSPKKEFFLGEYGPELGVPLVMGVGGAIDVAAGHTRRAPELMQRLGLEWLYRMLQEPKRLGRRYVTTNLGFLSLLGREFVRTRVLRSPPVSLDEQAAV
jgi:N-acetylglucosaminyldiphosphoundecaprenol N-acetyl-beta-D-mannosaminyltransferase